jgi:hypothetical protein
LRADAGQKHGAFGHTAAALEKARRPRKRSGSDWTNVSAEHALDVAALGITNHRLLVGANETDGAFLNRDGAVDAEMPGEKSVVIYWDVDDARPSLCVLLRRSF